MGPRLACPARPDCVVPKIAAWASVLSLGATTRGATPGSVSLVGRQLKIAPTRSSFRPIRVKTVKTQTHGEMRYCVEFRPVVRPDHQGARPRPQRGFRQRGLLGLARLLLRLLGLPLLFQRLLSRLLFHALLRVLVLGRHVLTSVWVRVRLSAVAQDVHHHLGLRYPFMCVAALPDASSRFHLRLLQLRNVRGLRRL